MMTKRRRRKTSCVDFVKKSKGLALSSVVIRSVAIVLNYSNCVINAEHRSRKLLRNNSNELTVFMWVKWVKIKENVSTSKKN